MAIHALTTPRHACAGCGGSCMGVVVRLGPEERGPVEARARALGHPDAVDAEGALRRVDGRCVLLEPDLRCGLHRAFGPEAKPVICRQYPLVKTGVGEHERVGVDPGCYALWSSWREAPAVPEAELLALPANPRPLPPGLEAAEAALLGLLRAPGASVGACLRAMAGQRPDPSLPEGFGARWARHLHDTRLVTLFGEDHEVGPAVARGMAPLVEALRQGRLDPAPPWPGLDAEHEALALALTQRMVWLRLGPAELGPVGITLLSLAGAVAMGWTAPTPRAFGEGMAAWTRLLRARRFWGRLAPTPQALEWLGRGP